MHALSPDNTVFTKRSSLTLFFFFLCKKKENHNIKGAVSLPLSIFFEKELSKPLLDLFFSSFFFFFFQRKWQAQRPSRWLPLLPLLLLRRRPNLRRSRRSRWRLLRCRRRRAPAEVRRRANESTVELRVGERRQRNCIPLMPEGPLPFQVSCSHAFYRLSSSCERRRVTPTRQEHRAFARQSSFTRERSK